MAITQCVLNGRVIAPNGSTPATKLVITTVAEALGADASQVIAGSSEYPLIDGMIADDAVIYSGVRYTAEIFVGGSRATPQPIFIAVPELAEGTVVLWQDLIAAAQTPVAVGRFPLYKGDTITGNLSSGAVADGWRVVADGDGGYTHVAPTAGDGDMRSVIYDPQTIAADAFDRANHTGAQAIATITNLQSTLDAKAAAATVSAHTSNVSNPHATTAAQTGALAIASSLSDLGNPSTARTNLGLGSSATHDVPASGNATGAQVVTAGDTRLTDARTPTTHASSHASNGSDPITPASIGAAPLASPTFTGTVTVPTRSPGDATTAAASTAFVAAALSALGAETIGLHPYCQVRDEKSNGTSGGTFTGGSPQQHTLTTVVANYSTGLSNAQLLSSNLITLEAPSSGTYRYEIHARFIVTNVTQVSPRLFVNGSDSGLRWPMNDWREVSVNRPVTFEGFVDVPSGSNRTLGIYGQCDATVSGNGWGNAAAFDGEPEVYAIVTINRVKI